MLAESRSSAVLVWAGWLLLALFLRVGPTSALQRTQAVLQAGAGSVLSLLPTRNSSTGDPAATANFERLQAENRELARLAAELRAENEHLKQQAGFSLKNDNSLLEADCIPARILGIKGDPLSANLQFLINLGRRDGLNDAELVLTGEGLLIDQGRDLGLQPDQLITAGRALLGRTAQVGERTALVQPLTDPSFRMAIRIIRQSPLGPVEGPAGLLAGTGHGCRLDDVAATEAVAPGDDIYTDPLVSPAGVPVYCGRVSKAEVEPTASHWKIEVIPSNLLSPLPEHVTVLRGALNSQRMTVADPASGGRQSPVSP
ncbi:rod shape-determining protein MreC [Planctomicrobium piriforme]|uniref:Cell shape-determining protein MreC n=1 Tax=Planctomicrobium piriforme TaxID=1576369 RepID=A0A1I3FD80_9PLAN|nr:rod shape-determining protein MreC [Planctomicrobium piriforme]SFI09147.1 Cell shape-determining protein MreC [Planctomicrobium piriforme]